jgi:L-threonylcarbamoyladenylate synthase
MAGVLLRALSLGFMIRTDDNETRAQASGIVSSGGLIAFRTDTFYGLGANPFNPNALAKIRELKGRKERKPILLLISDINQVESLFVETSALFKEAAKQYWPGPLTLIGVARTELPPELTAGSGTIGLRLPDDDRVRDLVRVCGGALTATSANPSGSAPALTAEEVQNYFPEGIDLIIDGGEVTTTQPSTVLNLTGSEPRLVREGAITLEELKLFLTERTK